MDRDNLMPGNEGDIPRISQLLYQMIDEKYRPLLDESSDLMCIADRDGKFIYVNKKMVDSLGYTKKEMLGMPLVDVLTQESAALLAQKREDFVKTGRLKIEHFILKTKFKGSVTGELSSIAFYDNKGQYCGAKSVFKDRTQLLHMERLERKYESMLEDGIGALDYVIIILDPGFHVKWASNSIQKYFGLDKSVVVGEDIRSLLKEKIRPLIPQSEAFLEKLFSAYGAHQSVESFECEILPLGGDENTILEYWSYPVTQGDLSGGRIEIFRDITARKKFEETLEYYYKKIHAIMEHAVEGIVEVRTDNSIEFVNKSLLTLLGFSETEMLDKPLSDFIVPGDRIHLASVKLIRRAREVAFVKKDGSSLYALVSSIPLVFGSQPPHALCFVSDITETKMATLRLKDANMTLRALNDSLLEVSLRDVNTGVYNYRYLSERLAEEIKRAKRYFRPFSVILLDIDFFKTVNDAYGHNFGDVVLHQFADLLKKNVRDTDIVVRTGGEEFVVFLADTDSIGALTVADKVVRSVEKTALGDNNAKIQITVSLGVASYPDIDASEVSAFLDAADQAMYQSKNKGRNKITIFNREGLQAGEKIVCGKGALLEYDCFQQRLKNVNLHYEAAILEAMMPMVREVYRRLGWDLARMLSHVEGIAKSFSIPEGERNRLKRVALLCNLGFLRLPQEALVREKALPFEEQIRWKEHPSLSVEMIKDFAFLTSCVPEILAHHESFDGRGYPKGLSGDAIPLGSRIIGAAETFEILSLRFSQAEAREIFKNSSGKQLDPGVVEYFLSEAFKPFNP